MDQIDLTARQLVGLSDGINRVTVNLLPDGRLSRSDAAAYLGIAPKTLAMWATRGKSPAFVRVGGLVFYFLKDLDAFVRG